MIPLQMVERMLNTVAEGMLVSMTVWLALRWLKPLNSGTRFAAWFSALGVIAALPLVSQSNSLATAAAYPHAPLTFSSSWAFYLFIAWAAIALILLARLSISLWHIRTLRHNASRVDLSTLHRDLQSAWTTASCRGAELHVSDQMRVPAALGFIRPVVAVPAWTLRELSPEELKIILLHELAHLRRWDDWTNLLQKVVKAVFFFHPAVWWIETHLSLEREMACDDVVLSQTSPKEYAKSLLSLAERVGLGKGVALAQAALGRAHQTSQRIRQILDSSHPRATKIWKPAFALVTAVSAVALLLVPYTPAVVAFQDHTPGAVPMPIGTVRLNPDVSPIATIQKSAPIRGRKQEFAKESVVAQARRPSMNPTPIQAGLKNVPSGSMLVVMRAVQYDESGISVWTLCVWQITNDKVQRKQLHPELTVNSL